MLGAIDWWVEIERIDDRVVAMATTRVKQFATEHLADSAAFSQPEVEIRAAVLDHFRDTFPIVELYDASRRKLFDYVAPGRESVEEALQSRRHGFSKEDEPYYERIDIGKDAYVQVILPLQKDGRIYGYFEGVYDVPDEAIADIESNVILSVLMIMVSVIVTGGVLYPLLMALNRSMLAASRRVLRGNLELLEVLGSAIAQRDSDTNSHNYRVTWYSIALAHEAGLSETEIRHVIAGAFLHDVGKIGISDNILLKPGKLTEEEIVAMRQHVAIGSRIILKAEWLGDARDVVEHHHEKWDGSGYPHGLRETAIPKTARIFAIADVFDALTSRRPYKEPLSLEAAIDILRKDAGSHFDPQLVELFVGIAGKVFAEVCQRSDEELEKMLIDAIAANYGL
jgi:HD-GYP domain-containing protein (c-di-GMP phosphodiesterase class II)